MNAISLQPRTVVTCGGAGFVLLSWFWGLLGLFSGAFCCWFGSAFGGGYFGLFLLPFCPVFWRCVELVLYSLLPGVMEWPLGHFSSFVAHPILCTWMVGGMVWRPFWGCWDWIWLDLVLQQGWRGWLGVVAFEGRIGPVMETAWGSLGRGGLWGWAGLRAPIMFPYGVITTYAVTLLAS